jgi:very-short-patch-repair endonuclease
MRHEPTPAERVLWRMLRGGQLGGFKFRRQVPLGAYIADFACLYPRTIIECDGGQHADSSYDKARDVWFRAQGFQVIRFWNNEIVDDPEAVAETISRTLGKGP